MVSSVKKCPRCNNTGTWGGVDGHLYDCDECATTTSPVGDIKEDLDEMRPFDPFPILPKTYGRDHSQSTVIKLGQWFLRNYAIVGRALEQPKQPDVNQELLEVAKAMANFDGRNNNQHLKEMARKALATLDGIIAGQDTPLASSSDHYHLLVPDGYKLVPIDPTDLPCGLTMPLPDGRIIGENQRIESIVSIEDAYKCAEILHKAMLSAAPTPVQPKCPSCGGEADNGFDREIPPNPYHCTKCSEPEKVDVTDNDVGKMLDVEKVIEGVPEWLKTLDYQRDLALVWMVAKNSKDYDETIGDRIERVQQLILAQKRALTSTPATSTDDGWNYDVSRAPRDESWLIGLFKKTYIHAITNTKENELFVLPIKFNLRTQQFHAFGDIFATSLGEFIAYMPKPKTPTMQRD